MRNKSKGFIGHRWLNTNGRAASSTTEAQGADSAPANSEDQPVSHKAGKRQDSSMARKQGKVVSTRVGAGRPAICDQPRGTQIDGKFAGVAKTEFARIMGVNPSTVSRWGDRGCLALAENGRVLVDESIRKLKQRYPEGTKAGLSVSKRHSYWSSGPHCMTTKAMQSWSKMKPIAK